MASTQTYSKSIIHNRLRLGCAAPNRRDVERIGNSLDGPARERSSEWGKSDMGGTTKQHGRQVSHRGQKFN
eukprot:14593250-Ditylum_brightwellii.AAC.1